MHPHTPKCSANHLRHSINLVCPKTWYPTGVTMASWNIPKKIILRHVVMLYHIFFHVCHYILLYTRSNFLSTPQISNTLSNLMLKSAKSDPSLFFSCFQPASFLICHSFHHFSSTFSTAKSRPPPPNLHLTPSYSHLEAHAHHLCQKSAQATTRGQATHDEIDHGGFDTFLGRFWVQRFQRGYGSNTSLERER